MHRQPKQNKTKQSKANQYKYINTNGSNAIQCNHKRMAVHSRNGRQAYAGNTHAYFFNAHCTSTFKFGLDDQKFSVLFSLFTFLLALDATLSYHFPITENVFIHSSHCKNSIAADFTQMCPLSLGIGLLFLLSSLHILSSIFVASLT